VLECREKRGREPFVIYKGALPKDHKLGEKEKKRKNKGLSTA
jgi:hypothetical protein